MARPKVHDDNLAELLIREAATCVAERGPDSLSLRGLTEAAGTSTSAIYSLFGSREALLSSVYDRALASFMAVVNIEQVTDDPLIDLKRMGNAYRAWALDNPHFYPLLVGSGCQRGGPARLTLERMQPLVTLVQRCLDAGLLAGPNAEALAMVAWSSVHGYVSLELAGLAVPSDVSADEAYDRFLSASLAGWRGENTYP